LIGDFLMTPGRIEYHLAAAIKKKPLRQRPQRLLL
jgi:hypothetical protein